ncbi:hypothetical protein [Corallococcus sp. Z5C101001]|uniref:hypothetical protein n=1 Tax=Corallococcus sp. Z5C101001 TaxID=2596829 RepID=UPI00117CF065|nr:hypothetical protein [Corallococcus sp. Z5C101001]TSC33635.1 hypothetical protein FOF48_00845 [Corallococcus sp. Z5C101001]
MMIALGVALLLAAAPEAKPEEPKQQAAVDAALKAVKVGDEKARKRAYASLWKLGVRVSLPDLDLYRSSNVETPDPATRPLALQGPGVLACPTPLWARQELAKVEANDGSGTQAQGVMFARSEQALSEGFLEDLGDERIPSVTGPVIVTRWSGSWGSLPCMLDGPPGSGWDLGMWRHPAARESLQRCCKGSAECIEQGRTGESDCRDEVLFTAATTSEKYATEAGKLLAERIRRCMPAGDAMDAEPACVYSDAPRCLRHRACMAKVGQESLARGTARWDVEAALWLRTSISACSANRAADTACTPIVVDACQGRVGYRCSDDSIRELQVP